MGSSKSSRTCCSKSGRMWILLGIDTSFFFLELIIGYASHSLALVADSFHMLNDVISLGVGLWAVKVAEQKTSSKIYTYGWQRVEILGALINGVFLVALCLSILLDALSRLIQPQEVSNPQLVLIVGCLGLTSNILGLFLFHDHGHSHGDSDHSHGGSNDTISAEEGHSHASVSGADEHTRQIADEGGNIADVLPQNAIAGRPKSIDISYSQKQGLSKDDAAAYTAAGATMPRSKKFKSARSDDWHRRTASGTWSRRAFSSPEDIQIHPASRRKDLLADITAANKLDGIETSSQTDSEGQGVTEEQDGPEITEDSPLLKTTKAPSNDYGIQSHEFISKSRHDSHADHKHNQPKVNSTHGHSHGDMNMRGVFLHVLGDALGNIGVITSALIIWLTKYSWRFYSDPIISLLLTGIILYSAIPLCKATSKVFLQAVPEGVEVDDIKEDIESLPGISSCHHLHVWQLSDTKVVATLHVKVDLDFKDEGSTRYMNLAKSIQRCLRAYGIHSSTIQPEFRDYGLILDGAESYMGKYNTNISKAQPSNSDGTESPTARTELDACLLDGANEGGEGFQCCVSSPSRPSTREGEHSH